MGRLGFVTFLSALFALFMEAEANPFEYKYERLRIGGLILACLLMAGGIGVIIYHKCNRVPLKKVDDDSEI